MASNDHVFMRENERGDVGMHNNNMPQWIPPNDLPDSKPSEEAIRLQAAIEQGHVSLAMQWASHLAKKKIKLNIGVDQVGAENEEVEIRVNIHIENKDFSLGSIQMDVKPSYTISTLKMMILQLHGFPPDIQKWIIGQQMVNDDITLAQCGVNGPGASLYLYLVSANSVGLSQEKFREKYGHLVKPGIPGLPRSLSQSSSISEPGGRTRSDSSIKPLDASTEYVSMRVPPVIDEVNAEPGAGASATNSTRVEVVQPPRELTDDEKKEKFGWSCEMCTFKNWPTWPGCEICDHTRPEDYRTPDGYTLTRREQERLDRESVSEAAAVEKEEHERALNYNNLLAVEGHDLIPNTEDVDCPICFCSVDPGQGVVLRECLHVFCRDCLKDYVNISTDAALKCPYQNDVYSCDAIMQDREIKALVTIDDFHNYLQRGLHLAENQATNSYHCKTTDCIGWCFYDDDNNFFNCPVCGRRNCLTCKAIHEQMNCKEYQDDIKRKAINDHAAQRTQKMLQDLLDSGDAMNCPRCDVVVMKKDGCDWICCSMCRLEICWVTKGPRWGPNGPGDRSGGCHCRENGKPCHPQCQNCH